MGSHLTFSREKETHGRWARGFSELLEFKLLIIIYPFDRDVYPKSGW